MTRRAIVYTRVSSDPSGHGRSVAAQERECREVCEREGWTVAEVLTDNDRGASRHSGGTRPAYDRLTEVLTSGDVLVTWEASRAQRDLRAYVELRDLCAERGVDWSYSGRLYEMGRGDDRFGTGLDALMAEREAEQIRERVLRGKRAAAEDGRPASRPPYGYRREFDPETGKTVGWVPEESEAAVIREVARRVLAGESLWPIVEDLNRRGVPAPKTQSNAAGEWRPQRLRVMISKPSYAGLRIHQGEVIGKGKWDALISPEDHELLVAILSDPARATTRGGSEPKHLLTGIAMCGVCGSRMRWNGPKSLKTPVYICDKSQCVGRRAPLVDELVTGVVLARLALPDAASAYAARSRGDGAADARRDLQALRARLEGFLEAAAEGEISPGALAKIEARLVPQIEEAEARTRVGTLPAVADLVDAPDIAEAWEGLSVRSRREVVRALVSVTVNKSTVGTRRFNPSDIEIGWKE